MTEKLTAKQQAFCESYVANGFNATQAALTAGYKKTNATQQGCENLGKPYIQEFIQNSIKHGKAKQIAISLINAKDDIRLSLYDNGKGFVVKDLMIYKGQGLKNIESRVKSLNGEIELKSILNKGTEFNISFPLNLN